ncbi:MAG TPA: hypothetical protein VG106_01410 [Vicinamibacterales bacterium]|nr:hypothetical protein [Vicinamibacterales bacterium]
MVDQAHEERLRWLQRLLEMVPGFTSWAIIILPVWLSFSYPSLVAYFVLSFDFYWLCRALWLAGAVLIAFRRVRRVLEIDWLTRCDGLLDLGARRAMLEARLALLDGRPSPAALGVVAWDPTAGRQSSRERAQIRRELRVISALEASGDRPPAWTEYTHLALIPTYTEPLEKLRATVAALAAADWPKDRLMVAIITRESDAAGRANVAALREEFGSSFADFIHILDPLEPGIVVGKSSAMAFGGKYLYRLLVGERGMDPSRVLITDLDADYRVHPQYFAYLTYKHLTSPNRETQLYQPIPMFHNNLWDAPLPVRLVSAGCTQIQMWRSVMPEKLYSFSSYTATLKLVHEVGYWATDAIPEDSRFYWKSFFTYGDRFRAVPLYIPIYGDAVRASGYTRSLVSQYMQIRRWAWGVTDIPYVIQNAIRHREIPLRSRVWRTLNLFAEHINWAIAPFVILFGSNVPLLINPEFAQTTLGQNLPVYASWMLTVALVALLVLIFVDERLAPPRPRGMSALRRIGSYLQWLAIPIVGFVFSNLPALDAQTRLLTGRYLEYRVTEKA